MKSYLILPFGASLSALLLLFTGCATPPVPAPAQQETAVPFDAAAYAPYSQSGAGAISGQAFLKTRGGDVKVGAGDTVTLSPATAFALDVRRLRNAGISPINYTADVLAQIKPTIRQTVADAQGNFQFSQLPPGRYLLEVDIEWEVPSRYGSYPTGGMVTKLVDLGRDQHLRVMLTE